MLKNIPIWLRYLPLFVFVALSNSLFIVNQTTQAIVLRFGEYRRIHTEPGLKIKLPFIEDVLFYETRILDHDLPPIDTKNNSPGFDLVIVTPDDKKIRIQSKLRQVKGNEDWSQQVHFETTRRNSEKNKDKNHTGHICYSLDEFDFVMVSLVNDKVNRDKIKDCNLWSYSLINIKDLEDKDHGCCVSHIAPTILKKNIIKVNEDIRDKLA